MNPEKWKTIKETFSAVLELSLPERAEVLSGSGAEIRLEVEKLLSAYAEAENFISTPLLVEKGLRKNRYEENLVGKQIDDYLVLKKLGEGGMGVVFLVEQRGENFSQKVALKLIKRGMDTNLVLKRFLMERQILANLEHPNIARLIDGGSTDDNLPYFVMEYVEGESIKKFCENQGYETKERLRLFMKVCAAISHAHQKLIIHRDIKPSNILVTEAGEPKLLDFGIAKLLSPDWYDSTTEPTVTDFRLMTPEYASPEQLRGKMTSTATDVYSLGVVLYELLTGTRPFKFPSKNPTEISDAILTQVPVRPSDAVLNTRENKGETRSEASNPKSQIPNPKFLRGDLDNIILKAIRREPERRYNSVHELCDDIHRYLNGLPVKATADTRIYRLQKFIKRHRAGVFASLAFVALLIISTTVTGWQYFIARRERAKAEQRFTELRGVAKSLLTDTNQALEKLPQGLEIRKSIIEKSVAVLDKLAHEETDDPNFLSELADAYDKLGKMRHWKFHESREALNNIEKALQFRNRAIRLAPTNVEIRKKLSFTYQSFLEIYGTLGNYEKCLEYWQYQRENTLRMIEFEPDNAHLYYGLSVQTEVTADTLNVLGRTAEADELRRQSFELVEKSISLRRAEPVTLEGQVQYVSYLMQKAGLLHKAKKSDEALAVYETAAEIAEKTYRADDSLQFAFNHTSRIHRWMADIYREQGNWRKFLENSEYSLNWIEQNLENKKLNTKTLLGGKAWYLVRTGVGLHKTGEKQAGDLKVEEGLALYRRLFYETKNDGENIFYASEMLEFVSEFYVETRQTEKAVELWRDFADAVTPFAAKNPDDTTSTGYLAYAYERQGDVWANYQKDSKTFAETDPARLRQALSSYQKGVEHRQKILQADPTNQTQINLEKTLSLKISQIKSRPD
jgi:eukaryotic-like serine/threonine-protein kinase